MRSFGINKHYTQISGSSTSHLIIFRSTSLTLVYRQHANREVNAIYAKDLRHQNRGAVAAQKDHGMTNSRYRVDDIPLLEVLDCNNLLQSL